MSKSKSKIRPSLDGAKIRPSFDGIRPSLDGAIISQKVVKHILLSSGRNQRKNLRSFDYFLCKTNPILSAVGGLQMNVNPYNTTEYENKSNWTIGENKPNSNPNKPNLRKAKMNVNLTLTKSYRKKYDFVVRINKPNSRNGQNERKYLYHKGL